jgi:hypothetical protein
MLKKCIAFAVVFAVAAGAAFAQLTVGGQLQEGITLLSGSNLNDSDIMMGDGYRGGAKPYTNGKINMLFGDGTAGGRMTYEFNNALLWGWMQWRPNQFFRIKIGTDGDGEGGFPQIVGWGFTGEAMNSVSSVNLWGGLGSGRATDYNRRGINYGAYDGDTNFNLGLYVFPTDMMTVTVLFRGITSNSDNKGQEISEKLAKLEFIAQYKIEEVGTIRFAAVGDGGLSKSKKDAADAKAGHLFLAFYSNEIAQGVAFEVGGRYDLPYMNTDQTDATSVTAGLNLTATDPFNFKLRTNVNFGGTDAKGEPSNRLEWGIGLLPSYKLPKMTVFLHLGFGMDQVKDRKNATTKELEEVQFDWFVNPFIWVPMGGMRMWVGAIIAGDGDRLALDSKGEFKWAIPFGFNFYF